MLTRSFTRIAWVDLITFVALTIRMVNEIVWIPFHAVSILLSLLIFIGIYVILWTGFYFYQKGLFS